MTQAGWLGCIPSAPNRQPTYLWMLKRDGRFAYRERLWEDDPGRPARGQLDVGAVLKIALATTYFLRKLAPLASFDPSQRVALQLDVEGVRGRSLVDGGDHWEVEARDTKWSEDHASAGVTREVGQLLENPFDVGLALVSELAGQINVDYARPARLRQLLADRKRQGAELGFIDDVKL